MVKHWVGAAAALLMLTACAGSGGAPEPTALPPPPSETPAAAAAPAAPAAAAGVAAPAASAEAPPRDGSIVVPGTPERPVTPPPGDPRSVAERVEDIRAWDQCVSRAQAQFETDPMRPQLESPEEVCSRSLGMTSRMAIPDSRR